MGLVKFSELNISVSLANTDMFVGYTPSGTNWRASADTVTVMIGELLNAVQQSLTIDGDGAAAERAYSVDVDAGYASRYQHLVDGVLRWGTARLSTGAWVVRRYDATGTPIDNPISIDDGTGNLALANGMAFGGNLRPTVDNSYSLGDSTFRMSVIYAGSGTINTSDERAKREIAPITDELLDAWEGVQWSLYRFKDAYDKNGEDARWHMGLIAQQVREAIDASMGEGEAFRLGLVCHDAWEARDAVTDPETGEVVEAALEAGDRWGLRYDECFALEAAYQRRRLDRIEAQLLSSS